MARKLKQAPAPIVREPVTPQAAIDHTLQSFRGEIERYETRKEKFLSDAKTNISYAIEWADGILQMEHTASRLKNLISAYEEKRVAHLGRETQFADDLALLKKFVDHVRKDNLRDLTHDYFRGASTSPSSNAVQHAHRAGAAHLEDVFESVSYWLDDATKGLIAAVPS